MGSSLFNISSIKVRHPSLQSFSCFSPKHPLFVLNTGLFFYFHLFPVIYVVMQYSFLVPPFPAVFCATAALFSNQFLLSSLAHCFTSSFFTLYSSLHPFFSHCDLAPSNFNFYLFPLLDLFPCFASYPWSTKFL